MAHFTLTAQELYQHGPWMDNSYFLSHTHTIPITSSPYPSRPRQMTISSLPTKKSSKPSQTRDTSLRSASPITKPAHPSVNTCNNSNAAYNLWNRTTIVSTPQNAPSRPSKITSSVVYVPPTKIFPSNFGITWPPKLSSRAIYYAAHASTQISRHTNNSTEINMIGMRTH